MNLSVHLRRWTSIQEESEHRLESTRYPKFNRALARRAAQLQEHSFSKFKEKIIKKPLVLDRKFYVYVLLDTSRRGDYSWKIKDRTFSFKYQPFYVGKGANKRMMLHVRQATSDSHKDRRIRKIIRDGYRILERKVGIELYEAQAFSLEQVLIKHLGRRAEGGVLTNVAESGFGCLGYSHSPEHKRALSEARMKSEKAREASRINILKAHEASRCPEVRAKTLAKNLASRAKWSDERREAYRVVRSTIVKDWWGSLSEEERARRVRQHNAQVNSPAALKRRSKYIKERNKVRTSCPHCDKEGQAVAMKRWHFDNCKFRS